VAHIGLIRFDCFEDIFLHIFSLGWRFVLWFLMTLTLPPIPTDFVPLVGKPPRYTIRRLPYPGNTRPYYQYLKNFDIEVPDVPEGVDPSDPASGYDWKGCFLTFLISRSLRKPWSGLLLASLRSLTIC
jgi:hypothetical protein